VRSYLYVKEEEKINAGELKQVLLLRSTIVKASFQVSFMSFTYLIVSLKIVIG